MFAKNSLSQDLTGPLTGVSWHFDSSRVDSPTMKGRFDAQRWVDPISIADQQLKQLRWTLPYLFYPEIMHLLSFSLGKRSFRSRIDWT